MSRRKTALFALAVAVSTPNLAGCGTITPPPEQIQSAYYGQEPTEAEVLAAVQAHLGPRLRDPYSAIYECSSPRRAWTNAWGQIAYGWAVQCTVNARNAYGGYAGPRPYGFLFRDGAIAQDAWANIGFVD